MHPHKTYPYVHQTECQNSIHLFCIVYSGILFKRRLVSELDAYLTAGNWSSSEFAVNVCVAVMRRQRFLRRIRTARHRHRDQPLHLLPFFSRRPGLEQVSEPREKSWEGKRQDSLVTQLVQKLGHFAYSPTVKVSCSVTSSASLQYSSCCQACLKNDPKCFFFSTDILLKRPYKAIGLSFSLFYDPSHFAGTGEGGGLEASSQCQCTSCRLFTLLSPLSLHFPQQPPRTNGKTRWSENRTLTVPPCQHCTCSLIKSALPLFLGMSQSFYFADDCA